MIHPFTDAAVDPSRPAVIGRDRRSSFRPEAAGWRRYALCRGLDPEFFFPVGEIGPEAVEHGEQAKAVCRACPVRELCLEFSVATNQEFGVWGGLTAEERRPLRRARRRGANGTSAPVDPGAALG